jgi:glutamine synthetase
MSEDAMARAIARAEELGVSHVNLGMVEINGSYRSKRYSVRHLKKSMTDGIAWLAIPSGLHPGDDVIITNPFANPDAGFRDGVLVMDPESCRVTPFDSGGQGLLLIGQFQHELADHCVRALLSRELERLGALGFDLYGGFELEGAVLAETAGSVRTKRAADVAVVPGFDRVYSFTDQSISSAFIDDVIESCEIMDLPLDSAHAEYVNMLEVGMRPATGVRIADNAALYKSVAKIVAARHDAYVTFMARRSENEQGCGAHINVSLRRKGSDENAFHAADRGDGMSDEMRHFLGGLSRYLPELFLMMAPHLNSYKRFQPGLFTPLNNTWGFNNKTVTFRVITVTPAATRIEVRPGGADVCPHLALLAVCAAGRLGIEQKIEPPEPVQGSGWSVEETEAPSLPLRFDEAIERFEQSAVAPEVTSPGFVEAFVGDRRWQQDTFANVVTDWELSMFGNL